MAVSLYEFIIDGYYSDELYPYFKLGIDITIKDKKIIDTFTFTFVNNKLVGYSYDSNLTDIKNIIEPYIQKYIYVKDEDDMNEDETVILIPTFIDDIFFNEKIIYNDFLILTPYISFDGYKRNYDILKYQYSRERLESIDKHLIYDIPSTVYINN